MEKVSPSEVFYDSDDCPKEVKKKINLIKINFYCKPCDRYFGTSTEFESHNLLSHCRKNKLACPHCDVVFKRLDHLKRHFRTHEAKDFCQCPICNKDFFKRDDLTEHLTKEHADVESIDCNKCGITCKTPEDFHEHDKRHFKSDHVCPHCEKMFRRKEHLKRHVQTQHSEDNVKCVLCNKVLKRKDHLLRHLREKHGKTMKNGWLVDYKKNALECRQESSTEDIAQSFVV